MNWKLNAGVILQSAERGFIRSGLKFVQNHYPYGRDWLFDVKRMQGLNPSVIIDAGANDGSVSCELNYWFPAANIYAFEPVLATYGLLVARTSHIKKIFPVRAGLGSKDETCEIALFHDNTINSLRVDIEQNMDKEMITIMRLDSFLGKNSLYHIDILKIDVEGFEFEVLNGCGPAIIEQTACICLEVGYERQATKVHFSDVESYMEEKGFILCGIYNARRNYFDKRRLWYSDNLYIKKNILTT